MVEDYQVRSALDCGLTPIIDATNLNPKTIAKWENIANEYNAKIEYHECILPFEEACKNDEARGNKVGRNTIKDFFKRYYPALLYASKEERKMLPIDESKPKCILVDIDGTLALRTNRSPFEYEKVEDDDCDFRMVELINSIKSNCEYNIIFVTGREDIGKSKECTKRWLTKHFGPEEFISKGASVITNWELKMRAEGDKRSDDIVKKRNI